MDKKAIIISVVLILIIIVGFATNSIQEFYLGLTGH